MNNLKLTSHYKVRKQVVSQWLFNGAVLTFESDSLKQALGMALEKVIHSGAKDLTLTINEPSIHQWMEGRLTFEDALLRLVKQQCFFFDPFDLIPLPEEKKEEVILEEEVNKEDLLPKLYAGIGSRETPQEVLTVMECLGAYFAMRGYTLRSGAAEGADSAFERGADRVRGKKEIYLPVPGFNKHESRLSVISEAAMRLAKAHHPAFDKLSYFVQRLIARNGYQVLGYDLKDPVRFVICYTKDGGPTGGTGQAMRIANNKGIPIYNLVRLNHIEALMKHVAQIHKLDLKEFQVKPYRDIFGYPTEVNWYGVAKHLLETVFAIKEE
jgi:hypothetical protein